MILSNLKLVGPYGCIGKQLALMELRYVVAQIVHRFDVSLAPGQSAEAFLEGTKDTFTLTLAPLNVIFTKRK
jgi:cytochrome P450